MRSRLRWWAASALAGLAAAAGPQAFGASLDLSSNIRGRYLTYGNLSLSPGGGASQAFFSEGGSLNFTVKNIYLAGPKGGEEKLDIGFGLSAYGIGGSTGPVQPPFDRAAARLPASNLTPFISAGYVRLYNAFDTGWQLTLGRMPFTLGSGLLVSDDGVGLDGVAARRSYEWRQAELQAFGFEKIASQTGNANLDVYGLQASFATQGRWELSDVIERQRAAAVLGQPVGTAVRNYASLRYSLQMSRLSFDGEGVLVSGSADPLNTTLPKISFQGSAFRLEGRWKQGLGRLGEGQARFLVGRGSGDDPGTPGTDESFAPILSHRYDGLERDGYGEFFGASLFDGLGGSTTTANGLPAGASGIRFYGLGLQLPAPRGFDLDLSYYFFFADRSASGSTALGRELDVRLQKRYGDRFQIYLSQAFFSALSALTPTNTSASRFMLGASGRF